MAREYETVIGLEVHVELATKTKIFCGCSTAFGGRPNSHTCPVCTGMPGTLPVLNRKVLEYAIAVGLATNCSITRYCKFDRKNYFYPDNPQNYQISQLYLPICRNGYVEIETEQEKLSVETAEGSIIGTGLSGAFQEDGTDRGGPNGKNAYTLGKKRIRIHEIHMEEDAGKLIHEEREDCTLVDFNRSGVPLIEIVTEPDMCSAREVIACLEKLRLIIRYLGASDCKLQEGSMRADVNLSVRESGTEQFGIRTEMKNLNSFRSITRAIENERNRQIDLIESGRAVIQETRRWDEGKEVSLPMRSKEDAKDYRYFPDPDLVPVSISDSFLEEIRARQPEFRTEKMKRYRAEYPIPDYDIEIITESRHMAELFEAAVSLGSQPKKVSNWLMGETLRLLKERELDPEDMRFSPEHLAKLIALTESGVINSTVAKEVFEVMFDRDVDPEEYVEEQGLRMVSDESALRKVVEEVIASNPRSVQDYYNGRERAVGFLVGQTMKATKGKANPASVKELLKELLEEEGCPILNDRYTRNNCRVS